MNRGQPKGGCLPVIILIFFIGIVGTALDFVKANWLVLEVLVFFVLICIVFISVASNNPFKITSLHLEDDELPSIQKKAAYKEITQISGNVIIGMGGFVFSAACFAFSVFVIKDAVICSGCIAFMILFYIMYQSYASRIIQLYSLLDGIKRTYICPYCKSTAIKTKFVRSSYTRGHAHSEVSENINPFKPFTYTNIDSKPVTTKMDYKNTYTCNSCGRVFDRPQVFEETK